jgi:hypothetical protein
LSFGYLNGLAVLQVARLIYDSLALGEASFYEKTIADRFTQGKPAQLRLGILDDENAVQFPALH